MVWQVVSLVTDRSPGEVEAGGDSGPEEDGYMVPYYCLDFGWEQGELWESFWNHGGGN